MSEPWEEMITEDQRKLFNAACGDLARCIPVWHGCHFDKDDYRHMISGTVMGWRTTRGIVDENGRGGWIMLGGSSLKLKKAQCTDAITIAFHIGDCPQDQGLNCPPVAWSSVVRLARGISDDEMEQAA